MAIFLFVLFVILGGISFLTFSSAQSAMHEIFAAQIAVGALVCLSGGAIVDAIKNLRIDQAQRAQQASRQPPAP